MATFWGQHDVPQEAEPAHSHGECRALRKHTSATSHARLRDGAVHAHHTWARPSPHASAPPCLSLWRSLRFTFLVRQGERCPVQMTARTNRGEVRGTSKQGRWETLSLSSSTSNSTVNLRGVHPPVPYSYQIQKSCKYTVLGDRTTFP